MSVSIKNLAAGSLTTAGPQAKGPAAGKAWIVKSVIVTNNDTVARTLEVRFVTPIASPSTSVFIAPPTLSLPGKTTLVIDNEITLAAGTSAQAEGISLNTPVPATPGMDYVMNGLERDL